MQPYVPHKQKIISSHDVVFDNIFSSALVYMSQPYEEYMDIRLAMSYISYVTSPKEQTGYIITFAHFEEGNLLSETRNYTEGGKKYDDNSTFALLNSEEETDAMSSGDESDDKYMSTDML